MSDVDTVVGRERTEFVPSPSCPESLAPQHRAVPSSVPLTVAVSPHVWSPPAETIAQCRVVKTAVGAVRAVVVPSPSCPLEFLPQQCASPAAENVEDAVTAQACAEPAVTEVHVAVVETETGDGLSVNAPSPS